MLGILLPPAGTAPTLSRGQCLVGRSATKIVTVATAALLGSCAQSPRAPRAEPAGRQLGFTEPHAAAEPSVAATAAPVARAKPRGLAPQDAHHCSDNPEGQVAWVSCSGEEILVAAPLRVHPQRPITAGPTRSALDAVASLLLARPEILLVRIEARSSVQGTDSRQRRHQIRQSQRCADAVLQYLWRRKGVSAERLEALGLGYVGRWPDLAPRWPIALRIVQWASPLVSPNQGGVP